MPSPLLASLLLPALLGAGPQELWQAWPEERFVTTPAPCLRPAELHQLLRSLAARHGDKLRLEEVGRSVAGRPIHLLTVGHGATKVLLWSQMHGDEPSATPALLDLADYLLRHEADPAVAAVLEEATLLMVPMLNPDGSEIYERRNAQGIDVNRDALNLATPEGRLLKRLRDEHRPVLGFNLHDQNRRTAVGESGMLATNAVLAVAGDAEGTLTPGRRRARRACAAIVGALAPFAPGGMARYDEDWSPRAFGDNLTAWGTPVVLLESGGLPPGHDLTELTRLNFVALVTVLQDLVRDDLAGHDPVLYEDLLRNRSDRWADVVVRGGLLLQPGTTSPYRADLAFDRLISDRQRAGCAIAGPPRALIVEIGDARQLGAGEELDVTGSLLLAPFTVGVEGWKARRWLDGELLSRLAGLGVGQVRWQVRSSRIAAASAHAREISGPGRAGVAVVGPHVPPAQLELTGPPHPPKSLAVDEILAVLGGASWQRLRRERSLVEALAELGPGEAEAFTDPALARGRPASFVVVGPVGEEGAGLDEAVLERVWLHGGAVPARP